MRIVRMRARARGRAGKAGRPVLAARLRGLRWVPVPLALLAAMLGLLVMGTMQGRAASDLAKEPNQAGGLSLSVDTMLWMANMSGSAVGSGASGDVTPSPEPTDPSGGNSSAGGYQMPDSMMPGMQAAGDNRLRVEVDLSNVSGSVQRYATTDFTVSGAGGKTWQVNGQEHSAQPASAYLQPGFQTTIDLYFDIPASDSKKLTLHWSRGGRTVSMPVNTGGTGPSEMPGM